MNGTRASYAVALDFIMIFAGIGLSVFAGVVIGDGTSPIFPLTIGLIIYLILMLGAIRLWTHTLNRV